MRSSNPIRRHLSCSPRPRRGGAVIIVVLSLLSLMLFLGVFFFEYAQEEQQSSEYFAGQNDSEVVNPEPFLEEAMQQLIVGPKPSRILSVLRNADTRRDNYDPAYPSYDYGNVHSILAHTLGPIRSDGRPLDVIPHNGAGIKTIYRTVGANTWVRFDHDGDGVEDSVLDTVNDPAAQSGFMHPQTGLPLPGFAINFHPMAQQDPTTDGFNQVNADAWTVPFMPDTDYTHADLNNLFLAHEETINGRRVLVPSFHRPVLFPARRDADGNGPIPGGGNGGFANLFTDVNTRKLVLRPHSFHRYSDNATARYLTTATPAQSGDTDRLIAPFPFTVDLDGDGIPNEMGVYTNPASANPDVSGAYELDVDANGDGKPDAIWMDLGLDLVELADGRQFVPMIAFYVIDGDGLINLNAHGNLQGGIAAGRTYSSGLLSVSNQGLSPNEINPIRALTGNPSLYTSPSDLVRVQAEHVFNVGGVASTAFTPLQMGNIEWSFLQVGRRRAGSGSPIPGRNGEEQRLVATPSPLMPLPGVSEYDDDFDGVNTSLTFDGGQQRLETLYDPKAGASTNVVVPSYVHPISLAGTGADVVSDNSGVEQRDLVVQTAGNPAAFPAYLSQYDDPAPTAAAPGVTPYVFPYSVLGATLMTAGRHGTTDEENELILSHNNRNTIADALFDTSENLFLQVTDEDYQRANGRSRLDMLAPFNFRSARDAQTIRKRFTADSWDLTELGYVYNIGLRPNEISRWSTGPDRYFFPPQFGSVAPFNAQDPLRPEVRSLLASETTLNSTNLGASRQYWRQRLNLNRLLVGFDNQGNPIHRNLMPHPDIVGLELENTGATMPTITIPAMIHNHTDSIPPNAAVASITTAPANDAARAASATAQEWWARYDRQRMARDVYTLLYLMGSTVNDDPTSTTYTSPLGRQWMDKAGGGPTTDTVPVNVREMAQFAVNYVDALDRDDVITTFEYDANLSDGWNNATEKAYGIERQSLTFSEVLLFQLQQDIAGDKNNSLHKEENATHRVLHVELRNASPFNMEVAEGWRLLRVASNAATPQFSYRFKTKNFGNATANAKIVTGGGNFHVACHDGDLKTGRDGNGNGNANGNANGGGNGISNILRNATSDIYMNIDGDPELESIVPNSAVTLTNNDVAATAYPPQTDVDFSVTGLNSPNDHEEYHEPHHFNDPSYTWNKSMVDKIDMGPAVNVKFDLVLQRRQNLRGIASTGIADADNESTGRWIEVDRFSVDSARMGNEGIIAPTVDTSAGMQTALAQYRSQERPQPFVNVQVNNTPAGGIRNHSISAIVASKHTANSTLATYGGTPAGATFTLYQPHFDRDFTSAYEMLSIPLYGYFPTETMRTAYADTYLPEIHGGVVYHLARGDANVAGGASLAGDYTAGARMLFPNGIPAQPYMGWNPVQYANDWHRLLELVQVPRRSEQAIASQYPNTVSGAAKPHLRTPGKMNLNTMRDETVLLALLDDELRFPAGATGNPTDDLIASGAGSSRNWYQDLRISRDGLDQFMVDASLPLVTIPGTIGRNGTASAIPAIEPRPFRSNSHVDVASTTDDRGIEHTMLRSRPGATRPTGSPAAATPANVATAGLSPWSAGSQTATATHQTLFDARNSNNNNIDYHTRNRILAKISNNTTTKSHVFFAWTAVGYFEAHKTASGGYVQIGARMTDLPIHRAFSVIDMTRLEEAYDPYTGTFDYTRFMTHRKRLR